MTSKFDLIEKLKHNVEINLNLTLKARRPNGREHQNRIGKVPTFHHFNIQSITSSSKNQHTTSTSHHIEMIRACRLWFTPSLSTINCRSRARRQKKIVLWIKSNQSTMAIIHGSWAYKMHIKWIIKAHKFSSSCRSLLLFFCSFMPAAKTAISIRSL